MKKICTGCGEERDAEQDFTWKYKDRGIRHTQCKFCSQHVSKEHYKNNKQMYLNRIDKRNTRIYEENKRYLYKYLSTHPCVDCHCADVRVLEFDHVRGEKSGNISRMVGLSYSWTTIEAEIAKCEVRCANCHHIKENEKSSSWRRFLGALAGQALTRNTRVNAENKRRLYAYLAEHPCVDCGQTDIRCLEFDHVRGNKSASITRMLNTGVTWSVIKAEIAKCEVRCANCHRIKTLERGKWWRFGLPE